MAGTLGRPGENWRNLYEGLFQALLKNMDSQWPLATCSFLTVVCTLPTPDFFDSPRAGVVVGLRHAFNKKPQTLRSVDGSSRRPYISAGSRMVSLGSVMPTPPTFLPLCAAPSCA